MTGPPRGRLPRSRFGPVALSREVSIGLVQRPGRSLLTVLGTVLGVGTLVAILGLTATAQGQISDRFTVLAATEVVVEQVEGAGAELTGGGPYDAFPGDAQEQIEHLNGVRSAGVWWPVTFKPGADAVSAYPPGLGSAADSVELSVYAANPGTIRASRPTWLAGLGYDDFHEVRSERVVVLGAAAARLLGVRRLDAQPAVFIGGRAFTVTGIIAGVRRNKEFLSSVLVPASTARKTWGLPKDAAPRMTIETTLGAAGQVAREAPLALRPDQPRYFRAIAPVDPRTLEANVTQDLTSLFLVLAAVSLIIGTFGIANTTLVSVLERVPEIGLRRALGARPRHIAWQFLAESAALGAVGGIVGTTLGIGTVLAVAIAQQWSPIMSSALGAAPVLGAITGLLAGLYPAWQATRVEPTEALRR